MTPVEIMALIVVVAAAIKIVVFLINPKSWAKVIDRVYGNSVLTMFLSLVLALVSLYFKIWV